MTCSPLPESLTSWLRRSWPTDDPLQARRLFHGRGRVFPGLEYLTIDWYPPLLLLTSYQPLPASLPEALWQLLEQAAPGRIKALVLQRRDLRPPTIELLHGSLPTQPLAREAGLSYPLRLDQGLNHGFFPDMARGRQWLRAHSRDRTILNLFAYTCSLSVAALAGGARQVVNLDMSKPALAIGRQAHRLNRLDLRRASFLGHDLFKSFARLEQLGPFDLVVIDPPAAQGKSFSAVRDWPRILRRLPGLLHPAGEILACVSAPELGRNFLERQFADHLPTAVLQTRLTAGDDFPEADPDKGWHLLHYRLN